MTYQTGAGRGGTRRRYLRRLAAAGTAAIAGCIGGGEPTVEVPAESRLDEPAPPRVTDVPGDRVTLSAETTVDSRMDPLDWRASATFAVRDGTVDLANQSPIDGVYEGTDPMGPFWAMETDNVNANTFFPLQTHEVTLSVSEPGGDALATATTNRVLPTAETDPLGEALVGTIHLPATDGPAPGVVTLHGSTGRELTRRAWLLAAHGFVVATPTYFGDDPALPDDLANVPVEYVERVIRALASHERVDGEQVGLYGVSKGAELALLAGSLSDRVGAVVGVAGSGLVWAGSRYVAGSRDTAVADTSSWSRNGDPVPYVSIPSDRYARTGSRPTFADGFEAASEDEIDAATIPVERIDGPVLFVSGRDDGLWDAVGYSAVAVDRLDRHGHPYQVEHLVYEDAGHLIRPPYAPTYGLARIGSVRYGGTPAGNAHAAADHWPRVIATFADALGS